VFRSDIVGSLPNMLFWVVDRPETDETKGGKSGGVESKVMSRNEDKEFGEGVCV